MRSNLIFCICLAVICGMCGTGISTDDICEKKDEFKIFSIFNLRNDIIIQAHDFLNISFWRISGTETGKHDKAVPMDIVVEPIEDDVIKVLTNKFDKFRQIFGYITPINHSDKCKAPTSDKCPDNETEFKYVVESRGTLDFICIHGFSDDIHHKPLTEVFKIHNKRFYLDTVTTDSLRDKLLKMCMPYDIPWRPFGIKGHLKPQLLSFVNWPEFGYENPIYGNISIVKYKTKTDDEVSTAQVMALERRGNTTRFTVIVEDFPKRIFHNIFKFNYYYKYLVMQLFSTLDTRLNWLSFENIDDKTSQLDYESKYKTNITLRKLLGCRPSPVLKASDRQSFCDNIKNIHSVFNLGKDLFFQSSARFYRLAENNFIDESNRAISSSNKYQIRSEPEMNALLSKDFDTTFPVFGFTFSTLLFDGCERNMNSDCNTLYRKRDAYYRTCLYGFQISFKKKDNMDFAEKNRYIMAFQYTPLGLKRLRVHNTRAETYHLCEQILREYPGMKGITNDDITEPYNNVVYILYEKDAKIALSKSKWSKNLNPKSVDFKASKNELIFDDTRANYLFYYKHFKPLLMYYYNQSTSKIARAQGDLYFNWFDVSKHFECPFESMTPLVILKRERICDRNPNKLAESAFNIGPLMYHQIGKQFFQFKNNYFRRDVYTSQILDLYFDTTHRVTAFSIRNHLYRDPFHEVIIHGKSSYYYRHLGQYICAVFYFREKYGYLRAMKPKASMWKLPISLGVLSPRLDRVGFIDAMGTYRTQYNVETVVVWFIEEYKGSDKYRYLKTSDFKKLFVSGDNKLRFETSGFVYNLPWQKVIGMVNGRYNALLMFASGNDSKIVMYSMEHPFNKTKDINNPELFKKLPDDFFGETCARVPYQSEQNSESETNTKTLSLFFGVLLLILLIISLVSALLLKQKNDKNVTKNIETPVSKNKTPTNRSPTENTQGKAPKKKNSLLSDLPSTDVQSIVIENKELKPVDSEVFTWKPKGDKPQPKVSPQPPLKRKDDKPNDKIKIKPKAEEKVKKEKTKKDNKDEDKKQNKINPKDDEEKPKT